MNPLQLLINTIGGGATGYITNDLAVKMLFRQYGPLGGVIIKTKAEFITKISALVERDIINHHTLEHQLDKPEFKAVVGKISDHILQNSLAEKTQGWRLEQVPAADQAWENLVRLYEDNYQRVVTELWQVLDQSVVVNHLFSDEQIDYLSERLIEVAIKTIEESTILENFMQELYLELKEKTLTDLLPQELVATIVHNWQEATKDFDQRLFQVFDTQLDATLQLMATEIDFQGILQGLTQQLQQKKLRELLGQADADQLVRDLGDKLLAVAKTKQGKGLLTSLATTVLEALRAIDKPVLELFNDDLRGSLEQFLAQRLPKIIFSLVSWIKDHQQELEDFIVEAIEETVNETLDEESGGLLNIQGKLKRYLFQFLAQGNALERFQIISKIIEGIEKNTDVHQLSQEAADDIINWLKTQAFGELVQDIEENGLMTPEKLAELIDQNLAGYFAKLDLESVQDYSESDLGTLVAILGIDLPTSLDKVVKHYWQATKTELLYTAQFTERVQAAVAELVFTTTTTNLAELISTKQLTEAVTTGKQRLLKVIWEQKTWLTTELAAIIRRATRGQKFSELVPDQMLQHVIGYTQHKSTAYLQHQWSVAQQRELAQLVLLLRGMEDSSAQFSHLMLGLAKQNLPLMTEGKIQSLVASNLSKLPDQQLQAMVEDFMGTELKPISALGGLFGVIFALAFHELQSEFGITASTSLLLNTGMYSFVGYITNVLALKMVFWPYKQKRILGVKVPFTPGIVAKSKPRFARSMGQFVGKELLNPMGINDTFQSKRPALKKRFMQAVAKDDYRRVEETLQANRLILTEQLYSSFSRWWQSNHELISADISRTLLRLPMQQVDFSALILKLQARNQLQSRLVGYLGAKVQSKYTAEKSLQEVLPAFAQTRLNQWITDFISHKITQVRQLLNDEAQISLVMDHYLGPRFEQFKTNKLADIFTEKHQGQVNHWLSRQLQSWITSPRVLDQLANFIKQKFLAPAGASASVGQWMHDLLQRFLLDHSDLILDSILKRTMNLLSQEKPQIKKVALDAAQEIDGYALANWFLDLDDTIDHIVERLVDVKIPEFMRRKSPELQDMLGKVAAKLLDDGVLDFDVQLAETGLREVLKDISQSMLVQQSVDAFSQHVVDNLFEVQLAGLLRLGGITKLNDLLQTFAPEWGFLREKLLEQLTLKQHQLATTGSILATQIMHDLFWNVPIGALTQRVDMLDVAVSQLFAQIQQSPAFNRAYILLLQDLSGQLGQQPLEGLIDPNLFSVDLNSTLARVLTQPERQQELRNILQQSLTTLFQSFNLLLPSASKDFLLEIVVESMLSSVQEYFLELMNTINIQAVTEVEINNMAPEQIEQLFNSFAGRYFRQLEHSGAWLGALVGIITESLTHIA